MTPDPDTDDTDTSSGGDGGSSPVRPTWRPVSSFSVPAVKHCCPPVRTSADRQVASGQSRAGLGSNFVCRRGGLAEMAVTGARQDPGRARLPPTAALTIPEAAPRLLCG